MKSALLILLCFLAKLGLSQNTSTILDERDIQESPVVEIDGTWWYAENSRAFVPGSSCYSDRPKKRCAEVITIFAA